jgi:acetyltransferase-like isoleucine patch superfamily enzyme
MNFLLKGDFMEKYQNKFKTCGKNVNVHENVFFEHPEVIDVGDNVTFYPGFYMIGKPALCRFGSNINYFNNVFIEGSAGKFIIGDNVTFFPGIYISLGEWENSFVEIGHHTHFAPYSVLYGWGGLKISAYCNFSSHVVLATVGHHYEITERPMALTGEKAGPITIEEDVWIAANSTVTANVTIAKGCVIGANSVVTKNTELMGIYFGTPARRLRDR